MYHQPVLLQESIVGMRLSERGIYVDATYGGGGHTSEILKNKDIAQVYAFDQDDDAIANKIDDNRLMLVKQNFSFLKNFLRFYNAMPIDGILADLGISSHQIDTAERGFSFRLNAPLDLRMNRNNNLSAKTVIDTYSEQQLSNMFFNYGELRNANKIAAIIYKYKENINTTFQLCETLKTLTNPSMENKFFAMVFQALRIEVNDELASLEKLLTQSLDVLKPGGRLVVISYHSLEDRLVKNFMKTGNIQGELKKDFFGNIETPFIPITKKAIIPSAEEMNNNSRSRSAKLRIAEKK